MFNEYDFDGDGKLSKAEFMDFMFSDDEEDMDEGDEEQDDGEIDIMFGDDGSDIIGGN